MRWLTWSRRVVTAVDATVGVHIHNDSDCAVAATLTAVEAGAGQVQGTMNGYGERCGNANLVSIIPALKLKMGLPVVADEQLALLNETAHFVADVANVAIWAHAPYVGRSAFAHKGGLHVAAVEQAPQTFEHVDPAAVGSEQRVLISELSGKGAVLRKAHEMGLELDGDDVRVGTVLKRLKDLEHSGYHYEAADASFELLLRDELAPHEPLFRLESFRVIVEKREDGRAVVEATIKVHVGGERIISTAEGNGPVNALDTRAAPGHREQVPAPRRHRAGQLQGAHPRREQGHGRRHARAAGRRATARRAGAASASARTSSRPAGRRSSTPSSTACCRSRQT